MNIIRRFTVISALIATSIPTFAIEPDSVITQSINASGVITVSQPSSLESRLRKDAIEKENKELTEEASNAAGEVKKQPQVKTGGYRVQVFSDNNPHTAKNEARAKAKEVTLAFPQYRSYVVFTAPYWRLRVGDFRSHEEAEAAATLIKKRFPNFSREVRVVRDRINSTK